MSKYKMLTGKSITSNTLVIFDEIQFCNKLLIGLKYFYESGVSNKIIATGSTLGISINKVDKWSYPVGKVNQLIMYPMIFEEFLFAIGKSEFVSYILNGLKRF